MLFFIALAGGLGGGFNALISDNGFILPKSSVTRSGGKILRPGFLGNIFIGALAASISWGLYGPMAGYVLMSETNPDTLNSNLASSGLTLSGLVGGALIGVGGAKWLTDQVDKTLLRAAASDAASGGASTDVANQIATAGSPAQALQIASGQDDATAVPQIGTDAQVDETKPPENKP